MKKMIAAFVACAVFAGAGMVAFAPAVSAADLEKSKSKCSDIKDKAAKKKCKADEKAGKK
ncbi:MAG: hypothetical protein H7840_03825 [Alphaproteobacteria bacterium]